MLAQVLTPSLHAKYNEDFTFRYTRDSQNINRRLGEDLERHQHLQQMKMNVEADSFRGKDCRHLYFVIIHK